jgi:hypothetical protein
MSCHYRSQVYVAYTFTVAYLGLNSLFVRPVPADCGPIVAFAYAPEQPFDVRSLGRARLTLFAR